MGIHLDDGSYTASIEECAYEVGKDFLACVSPSSRRQTIALHPHNRRIDSNEHNKKEGYWASLGTDQKTGQPITTCEWIDRLAPNAWAVLRPARVLHTAESTRWKAIPPAAWDCHSIWASSGSQRQEFLSSAFQDAQCSLNNMMETLLYLLYVVVGRAPMIALDECLRPNGSFGQTVHEGCDRGGNYEQAQFCRASSARRLAL